MTRGFKNRSEEESEDVRVDHKMLDEIRGFEDVRVNRRRSKDVRVDHKMLDEIRGFEDVRVNRRRSKDVRVDQRRSE